MTANRRFSLLPAYSPEHISAEHTIAGYHNRPLVEVRAAIVNGRRYAVCYDIHPDHCPPDRRPYFATRDGVPMNRPELRRFNDIARCAQAMFGF